MIQPNHEQISGHAANEPAGRARTPEQIELAQVVVRAQAGDLAAQSDLVRRYTRRIAGHIRSIIRQPDAVEDVSQTVFIKMNRRLARLRDPGLFECWLFTLSRNTSLDFIRSRQRRPAAVALDDAIFELPDSSTTQSTNEICDELDLALARLKPLDRTLIRLYVAGNSYRVMAAREGLTPGAVKARLHRVRPFLRTCLGGRSTGDREMRRWPLAPAPCCAA